MAIQHLRSSTANKRPTPAAMSDGQLAINSNTASPGLFFKDSAGALIKIGPVHVGSTAPNASPAAGGETGNTVGEQWLDTSSSRYVFKIWDGTAWRTEDGEFVNSSGDTMTGALVMDNQQQIRFREATANGTNYIALQASASVASDKTITLPDVTGTVVTTGDTGSVTSTMILDGTIVDGDISATAEIAVSKLADGTARQLLQTDAAGTGVEWASNIDIPGTLDVTGAATFDSTVSVTGALTKSGSNVVTVGDTGTVTSTMILDGTILDADVSASAAIAGTKISPNFGSQNTTTTGTSTAASFIPTSSTAPTNGLYLSGTNTVGISTGGTGRLFVDANGNVGLGTGSPSNYANFVTFALADTSGAEIDFIKGSTIQGAVYNAGDIFYLESRSTVPIAFVANSAERARIRADGMFEVKGAGTAGSSPAFSVNGSAPANSFIINSDGRLVTSAGTTTGDHNQIVVGINNVTGAGSQSIHLGAFVSTSYGCKIKSIYNYSAASSAQLAFETSNSSGTLIEAMRIDASQRVGIGTTSPGALLHSYAGASSNTLPTNAQAIFENSANGGIAISTPAANAAGVYFPRSTNAYYAGVERTGADLSFLLNGSTRATIDSSGRLLVGTSSSAGNAKLEVTETRRLSATSGGSGWLELTDSASVTSGTLTNIATASLTGTSASAYFRLEAFAGHTDSNGGYSNALSIREGFVANYGGTPRITNSTEVRNLTGSVNAAVIATAITTDVTTGASGTTSTVIFRATVTMSGSVGSSSPRVSYRLSLLSLATGEVTVISNI